MKLSFRSLLFAGLALIVLAAGCAPRQAAVQPTAVPVATVVVERAPAGSRALSSAPQALAERKIILTTNLQLTVQETEKTVNAIKGLVATQGGYVASANVWRVANTLHATLSVRVPADKLDLFVSEVKKLAVRVEREEASGQDVTEEYVDIQAQLQNLEATEKELRELLTTVREKTGKAEDVMAVYRELTNVRGEIDRLKGRMQYLDRLTALATVNLELSEREPEPIGQPGWQPGQTLRRALNALVQTLKFGVDVAIWILAYVVPLLIVPVLVIGLIWYLTRRRRTAHRT